MEPQDLEKFRIFLNDRRDQLLEQGDIRLDPNRRSPNTQADEDEQPLNEMNQVIASRRNRQRVKELDGIERALQKIALHPDEYGYCSDCEEPIALKRLEIMPWATHCVQCQAKNTDRHRSTRRRHLNDFVDD